MSQRPVAPERTIAEVAADARGVTDVEANVRMSAERKKLNKREWAYLFELWAGIILLFGPGIFGPANRYHTIWEWAMWAGLVMIIHAGIFSPHSDTMANYH